MNTTLNPNDGSLVSLGAESLLALINAAPDPMIISDDSGTILLASGQVQMLLGHHPDDLCGKPIEQLLPTRYRHAHPKYRANYGQSADPRPMGSGLELTALHMDGREIPVEVSLSPVATANGLLICSSLRDISDHRLKEQNLTSIIETSLNEIYLFDVQTLALVQVNRGARENLGYSSEQLPKLTALDLLPMHTRSSLSNLLAPLNSGQVSKLEFNSEHQRKDGSRYPVEIHLQRSRLNTLEVYVAIVLDITERHQAEAQLRAANEQLEQKVAERTAALEAANATKSRFLAAASHDLRQPLQSLGLYLSVLERISNAPKQVEVAGKMRGSLDTMSELLNALLDISRFDGDSTIADKRDYPLQESIDRLVNDTRLQAEQKGLQLLGCSTPAIVHSDPVLLERVIENFLTNAIRYTDQGSIEIQCNRLNNAIAIDIIDTGIGIPLADQSKIFEEYYQLDNPVRDRRKGLGLGLAIVKHISRMLAHPVSVVSTPGQGSTFRVLVPLADQQTQAHQSTPPDLVEPLQQSIKVMLVDDDPTVLDATSMLLEALGITLYSFSEAQSALAELHKGSQPDCLISDYRLPGMNGVEFIRSARDLLKKPLPAILITGDTTAKELASIDLENCTRLNKPINASQLIKLIEATKIV